MKLKKNLYIFVYIIIIIFISIINKISNSDLLYKRLNLPLTNNPIIFLIIDGIILYIIMKKLKKEPYILQERVIHYFKTMNNFILFIVLIYCTSFISVIVNMISNIILVYLLRPMNRDPNEVNGVEEYFNKYPEKKHHKFYKNIEEIKKEYRPLKKEVEVEIPALGVKIKHQKKDKIRKIKMTLIPILVITLVIVGIFLNIVEFLKTFSRAKYNYWEVEINNQEMNIFYNEDYDNVIIPFIYKQHEEFLFQSNMKEFTNNNYLKNTNSLKIKLTEYECINNDKGKNVRVSCGQEALSESKKRIVSTKSRMKIVLDEKEIYNGEFIEDITKYLKDDGKYKIIITNKKDKIETKISFYLSINELGIGD